MDLFKSIANISFILNFIQLLNLWWFVMSNNKMEGENIEVEPYILST